MCLILFQLCIRSMSSVECIGSLKVAMKHRKDMMALAAEALAKMFEKGEEELVSQVGKIYLWLSTM